MCYQEVEQSKINALRNISCDDLFDNFDEYNILKKLRKKEQKVYKIEKTKEDLNVNLLELFDDLENTSSSENSSSEASPKSEATRRKNNYKSNSGQYLTTEKKINPKNNRKRQKNKENQ